MRCFTKISLSTLNRVLYRFIPKKSIIGKARMFLKRLISCQSFSIIRPWTHLTKFQHILAFATPLLTIDIHSFYSECFCNLPHIASDASKNNWKFALNIVFHREQLGYISHWIQLTAVVLDKICLKKTVLGAFSIFSRISTLMDINKKCRCQQKT